MNVQAGAAAGFAAATGHAFQLEPRSIVTLVFEKPVPSGLRRAGRSPAGAYRKPGKSDTRTVDGCRLAPAEPRAP